MTALTVSLVVLTKHTSPDASVQKEGNEEKQNRYFVWPKQLTRGRIQSQIKIVLSKTISTFQKIITFQISVLGRNAFV